MDVEVLELCDVAPPQGAVAPTSLRLTCFDLIWVTIPVSTQFLFLYDVPRCSISAFLRHHLPNLKRSLSLALTHFFPLAGRLMHRDAADPFLHYADGDSLSLTVAKSDDDLRELSSHQPREASRFRCLVPPPLAPAGDQRAVAAIQVTLFPDQGVTVGITALHAAMDGSSFLHFARTWASICRTGGEVETELDLDLPVHDRSVIPDSESLREPFLAKLREPGGAPVTGTPAGDGPVDLVRATFTLTAADLERLRAGGGTRHSSLSLTVALVWTCLLRAWHHPPNELEALVVPVECRPRLNPPVSAAYFGNCVSGCFLTLERSRLVGGDGAAVAAAAITEAVKELEVEGGLQGRLREMFAAGQKIGRLKPASVAGSPRLGAYGVDFGWGRPTKFEVVSIDGSRAVSVAERRDEAEGGLEVGLSFPARVVEDFGNLFHAALRTKPDSLH